MNKKICKQCDVEFTSNNKVYCSKKCVGLSQRVLRVEISCKTCKSLFFVREKELNSRDVKYCSIKCRDIGRYNDTHRTDVCKICRSKFTTYKKNDKEFCGWICQQEWNRLPENVESRTELSILAQRIKYDGKVYCQTDEFVKKSKKTKLKRYGDENYVNVEKRKQTKLKRYGDENYNNTDKREKACLDKYGVNNFSKTAEFKEAHAIKVFNKLLTTPTFKDKITPMFKIEDYKGISNTYKFKCRECNSIFEDHLNNGRIPRCNICYPLKSTSLAEKEVLQYIRKLLPNTKIIENDKTILRGKELDIYIPAKKIAIEYNGLYWHSELNGKDKKYHLNKTIECNKARIRLIQLFEDEWVYKQNIVKSRLKHIMGISDKIVYARKCIIEELSPKEKNDFLDEIHIQGGDKSGVKLGAYYNDELVSVMTFSKTRIALGSKNINNNEYELSRFATKYQITGIANKLLKHFIKNNNPKSIISYSDRRWNTGKLYENLGFTKISDGVPGYWYINDGSRIHRFNFRKNVLNEKLASFDDNLTEWDNMQLNGYDRIWDCGHLKYEMIF
jgi:hypothetical protein